MFTEEIICDNKPDNTPSIDINTSQTKHSSTKAIDYNYEGFSYIKQGLLN